MSLHTKIQKKIDTLYALLQIFIYFSRASVVKTILSRGCLSTFPTLPPRRTLIALAAWVVRGAVAWALEGAWVWDHQDSLDMDRARTGVEDRDPEVTETRQASLSSMTHDTIFEQTMDYQFSIRAECLRVF